MNTGRLEAFSDGVVAIIITIMVLDMKVPAGADLKALESAAPVFAGYALSYVNVGIFWINHHHMLHAAEHVDGRSLWSNLFLLFWLSMVPFAIRWVDESHFAATPTAGYGVTLALAAIGYNLLQRALIACNGAESRLAMAIGSDIKGRASLAGYVAAVPLAFVSPWISIAIYILVAGTWFIPDRRIEMRVKA